MTASPTTSARTDICCSPSLTLWPTARISQAIARPCAFIQTTCQPISAVATNRIPAFTISCPAPLTNAASIVVAPAISVAPPTPPAIPSATQNIRCRTPRVAARIMETISAASRTSRKTIRAVANMKNSGCGYYLATIFPVTVSRRKSSNRGYTPASSGSR